jgi:uncharacterized protein DUF1097
MPQLFALSLSIAVLGAIWAFLALGPLSSYVLVWAGFIAWGCFFLELTRFSGHLNVRFGGVHDGREDSPVRTGV